MRGSALFRAGVLLLLALFASRIHLVVDRLFDPDEFEHAHASLEIWRGKLPYRDFFEHHGPLPYFLAAPLPALFGVDDALLMWNRVASLVFSAATLWKVYQMGRSLRGPNAGLLACLWLETMPWFLEKSIEWRPDVPATCFLALAAAHLLKGRLSMQGALAAGLLFGLATLCTPKVAVPILCLSGAYCISEMAHRRNPFPSVALGIAGGICAWLPFFGWFAWRGGLASFVDCVLVLPATWQTHRKFIDVFRQYPQWAPGHLGLLAWALLAVVVRHWRPRDWLAGPTIFAFAVGLQFALVPVAPAAYLQYYLIVLPLAAVAVGVAVGDLAADAAIASRWRLQAAAFGVIVGGVVLIIFAQSQAVFSGGKPVSDANIVDPWRPRAAFEMLSKILAHNHPTSKMGVLALFAAFDCICVVGSVAGLFLAAIAPRWFAWLTALALLAPGYARIVNTHFLWKKDQQIADLAGVRALVGSDGVVLDGFTGLGWQNPPALYWWWINQHNAWLIEKRGGIKTLREAVEQGAPDLIVFDKVWNNDERMRSVYDAVIGPMGARYRPTRFQPQGAWCMLFLRNDLPDRSAAE